MRPSLRTQTLYTVAKDCLYEARIAKYEGKPRTVTTCVRLARKFAKHARQSTQYAR